MYWNLHYWHILDGKANVVLKHMISAIIQIGMQILTLSAGKIGQIMEYLWTLRFLLKAIVVIIVPTSLYGEHQMHTECIEVIHSA